MNIRQHIQQAHQTSGNIDKHRQAKEHRQQARKTNNSSVRTETGKTKAGRRATAARQAGRHGQGDAPMWAAHRPFVSLRRAKRDVVIHIMLTSAGNIRSLVKRASQFHRMSPVAWEGFC